MSTLANDNWTTSRTKLLLELKGISIRLKKGLRNRYHKVILQHTNSGSECREYYDAEGGITSEGRQLHASCNHEL
jgi:hypothetical protein